jgi:hypothetical protein
MQQLEMGGEQQLFVLIQSYKTMQFEAIALLFLMPSVDNFNTVNPYEI